MATPVKLCVIIRTSPADIGSGLLTLCRSTFLSIVAMLVVCTGCHHGRHASELPAQTDHPPQAHLPATDVAQGLIEHLIRPYWPLGTKTHWEAYFATMRQHDVFDLDARNRQVASLVKSVQNMPNRRTLRILMLEHLGQSSNWLGSYERITLCRSLGDANAETNPLIALGVEVVDQRRWATVEKPALEMLKFGGSDPFHVHMLRDDTDAIVLSFYNGETWTIETWFALSHVGFGKGFPESANELPEDVRAFFKLLNAINSGLGRKRVFADKYFGSLVDLFGRQ